MTKIPAGRQRYLNWAGREEMRLQVVKEQAVALEDAGARRMNEATTRDEPARGYPKPAQRSRGKRRT